MPVVSDGVFFPLLGIYTATDLHCNLVKHIRAKMKGRERREKKRCYLHYIPNGTEFLYKPLVQSQPRCRLFAEQAIQTQHPCLWVISAFRVLFWGDGWLALDLLYYHSFLLSLCGKGLSDLSDPPWMQLHA